ncbi:hypothetical protein [Nonomuraea sp. bgisy101]|uniref:hypothetical protein n=1 Tax=Nonomuraea sp. bgisy101 TaxID=3413784 RepID=UPI003D7339F1
MAWQWDVSAAKKLAVGRVPDTRVEVAAWAAMARLIGINADHVPNVELDEPLIAVPVPNGEGPMIIDGWHRICKALRRGVPELDAVALTSDEELACRIHGGEKGYGWSRAPQPPPVR